MTARRKVWIVLGCVLVVPVLYFGWFIFVFTVNPFHAHQHCIVVAGSALSSYALDHNGQLPYDTNGFGNALLLLVKGGYFGDTNNHVVGFITGPGDDGSVFREALNTGAHIPEEKCSRVYVQGLSETNNPEIAILWDKKPCRGGDHFRRPWGPLVREVCSIGDSLRVIPEQGWQRFASNQIELLVQEGIPRKTAQHYYEIPQ